MNRDRGVMKWTSMMLPEHVESLRKWKQEQSYEKIRLLDEQELETLHFSMVEALENGTPVILKMYSEKRKIYEIHEGLLSYKTANLGEFYLTPPTGKQIQLNLHNIIEINRSY